MAEVMFVAVIGMGVAAVLALSVSGWWGGWGWWGDRGDVTQTVTVNVDAGKATEQSNAVAMAALALAARSMRQGQPQAPALPYAAAPPALPQLMSSQAPTWTWDVQRGVYVLPLADGSWLLHNGRDTWREGAQPAPPPRITIMGRELPAAAPHVLDDIGLDMERTAAEALSRRLPPPRS